MPRVGFLIAGDPEPFWTLFRKAMADLGYVEGRTIKYEYRVADAGRGELPRWPPSWSRSTSMSSWRC